MTTYAISFDLKYNETYSDRYASLMKVIRSCKSVWAETTSFALVDTSEDIETLERRLYLSSFSSATDRLLVINVSYDDATARGAISDKSTLEQLLPSIKIM